MGRRRKSSGSVAGLVAAGVSLGAVMASGAPDAAGVPDVVREGAGERRAALDRMERQPLDPEVWSRLESWSTESAITPSQMRGRVVLAVTWSSWYPRAQKVLPMVQSLHDRYEDEGLLVIGVHHERGFSNASAVAESRGVTFPYAHDADGSFRSALKADQDPDFYVIDRASQLRYADIATSSVEEAVTTLLEESRQEAASLRERLEQRREAQDRLFRQTESINQSVDLRSLPAVSFTAPGPQAYASASWPDPPPKEPGSDEPRWETGRDEDPLGALSLPSSDSSAWAGDAPEAEGRVRIAYFWNPDVRARVYEDAMREMERVQKEYGRDVVVIGVLSGGGDYDPPERYEDETEAERRQRWRRFFQQFAQRKQFRHHLLFDPGGSVESGVVRNDIDFTVRAYDSDLDPMAVVASSDGRVRWYGFARESSLYSSLTQILRADPGVRARRQAERTYIREQQQPGP